MQELTQMAERVGALLKERRETVAVAESSAGGLIAAALLAVPGASAYFLGGAVVYTAAARRTLLGLADADLAPGTRSSSEPYAKALAAAARGRLGTVWGLAETGAAGPTGNRYGDAAGHSCIAVAGPVERATTLETGSDDREANMWLFARAALEMLEAALKEGK